MKQKLNLDVYRFIAALMIVAIHVYPLSVFSEDLDYFFTRVLFRIAVPLFLMITGYFVIPAYEKNNNKLKTYILKILKIYMISILIYIPINVYTGNFNSFNIITFFKDILFNGTMYHLWYFPALIMGLYITCFILKKFSKRALLIFILLYIIGLFGDSYYGLINNIPILNNFYSLIFNVFNYTRNGLFYVPIFLYIGYMFNNKSFYKNKFSFLILFLLLGFMLVEGMILYYNNIPRHTSMYLLLVPVSFVLFKILLSTTTGSNKNLRNLATWIYILHPLFIVFIRIFAKVLNMEFIMINNSLINYCLVVISTVLFIIFIRKIKEKKWS